MSIIIQLIILIHRIEIAHAERMKYVVALSNLRGVEIEKLMVDLGIKQLKSE